MRQHTTIAIIGGSYAGLSALLVLRKRLGKNISIKLFEQRTHFCHIPALHEAILAPKHRLDAMQISYAKRYPSERVQAKVNKIEAQQLTTEQGDVWTFDYCVIATGSRTNFFGKDEREKIAFSVRYADDISRINEKLRDPNTKTITVIGGGYTGIEAAGTIALRKRPDQTIRIIHSKDKLFDRLSSYISDTTIDRAHRHGIEVVLNSRVNDITSDTLTLTTGEKLSSDMTIVSRGIRVNDESFAPNLTFNDAYTADRGEHIFICGDVAAHGLIATAHNAMFEGRRTGDIIADMIEGKPNKIYPPLQNRDKLAIALGPYDGILTNGKKGTYLPRVVGLCKRVIERRVLFEFTQKIMLWI